MYVCMYVYIRVDILECVCFFGNVCRCFIGNVCASSGLCVPLTAINRYCTGSRFVVEPKTVGQHLVLSNAGWTLMIAGASL